MRTTRLYVHSGNVKEMRTTRLYVHSGMKGMRTTRLICTQWKCERSENISLICTQWKRNERKHLADMSHTNIYTYLLCVLVQIAASGICGHLSKKLRVLQYHESTGKIWRYRPCFRFRAAQSGTTLVRRTRGNQTNHKIRHNDPPAWIATLLSCSWLCPVRSHPSLVPLKKTRLAEQTNAKTVAIRQLFVRWHTAQFFDLVAKTYFDFVKHTSLSKLKKRCKSQHVKCNAFGYKKIHVKVLAKKFERMPQSDDVELLHNTKDNEYPLIRGILSGYNGQGDTLQSTCLLQVKSVSPSLAYCVPEISFKLSCFHLRTQRRYELTRRRPYEDRCDPTDYKKGSCLYAVDFSAQTRARLRLTLDLQQFVQQELYSIFTSSTSLPRVLAYIACEFVGDWPVCH